MTTVLSDEIKTARKEHPCNYCNGVIKKGADYHHQKNVYEGHLYTWKSHIPCDELAMAYSLAVGPLEEGIPPMHDWEPEYLSEEDQQKFKAIYPSVKDTRESDD